MIDGPFSAPSSPPETPMPTKCRSRSRSAASRRRVSLKCALPPSMMHVAWFEQRGELVDHGVGGRAGVDHDEHAPRPLERGDELLGGLGPGRTCPRRRMLLDSRVGTLATVRLCSATV